MDPLRRVVMQLRLDWLQHLQVLSGRQDDRSSAAGDPPSPGAVVPGAQRSSDAPVPSRVTLDLSAWMLQAIASLRAAGLPLERLSLALVPERSGFLGAQHQWSIEEPERVRSFLRLYEFFLGEDHRTGVLHHVCCTGRIERLRLQERPAETIPFPLLRDLRRDQFSDYLAVPLPAAGSHRLVLTLATRHPQGFAACHLGALNRLLPVVQRVQRLSGQFGMGRLEPCDPLTALLARHRFEQELEMRLAGRAMAVSSPAGDAAAHAIGQRRGREGEQRAGWSLLALDLDGFGAYNRVFGHFSGDDALVTVARQLQSRWGSRAPAIARIGSDAFALVLPAMDPAALRQLAEQLQQSVLDLRLVHPPAATPFLGCTVAGLRLPPAPPQPGGPSLGISAQELTAPREPCNTARGLLQQLELLLSQARSDPTAIRLAALDEQIAAASPREAIEPDVLP